MGRNVVQPSTCTLKVPSGILLTLTKTENKGPGLLPGELLGPDLCILPPAPHWTQPGLGRAGMLRGALPTWISQSELLQGQKKGTQVGMEMGLAGHGGGDYLFAGQ